LAHSVWQTANKIGKKCTNLSLTFGALIVGEIKEQIFHATVTFSLAKKFGEIDPYRLQYLRHLTGNSETVGLKYFGHSP